MSILITKDSTSKALLLIFGSLVNFFALANGEIGDHVNDLQGHLNQYEEEQYEEKQSMLIGLMGIYIYIYVHIIMHNMHKHMQICIYICKSIYS